MDKTVAELNIRHLKQLLETETDPVKKQTIQRLLAEEEALAGETGSKPNRCRPKP